ncbi:MAG TPA: TIGR03619 family F420-dependent LLM class oxidoreductase [Pseudonocardiaceae bacterium]|nr:TIGR03619 family F420-dependent LLM class oxidoreductase [Pseudonocardiaceae bacterium]
MHIGFAVPVAGSLATVENQLSVAQQAEALGYRSLWTLQRILNSPDPADASYRDVPDPLLTLAYLAGHTTAARLGVAVVNMPFVSPALLAKQAATLDRISHGRFDLGLGLGWMPSEFVASGVSTARRGARAEEYLDVLTALWTGHAGPFDGEFYQLPEVVMSPTPVQRPRPPILLGGASEAALRRAGRRADGWISASGHNPHQLRPAITTVRQAAADAGRDPDTLRFVCRVALGGPVHGPDSPLSGDFHQIRGATAWLADQGVTELFYDPNFDRTITTAAPDDALRVVTDMMAALAP